jgi:hypothetical protein
MPINHTVFELANPFITRCPDHLSLTLWEFIPERPFEPVLFMRAIKYVTEIFTDNMQDL